MTRQQTLWFGWRICSEWSVQEADSDAYDMRQEQIYGLPKPQHDSGCQTRSSPTAEGMGMMNSTSVHGDLPTVLPMGLLDAQAA